MMTIILKIIFYAIMFLVYQYANGKLGKGQKYEIWVEDYGRGIKKNVLIIIAIYTIGVILF
jgi:hypothetical protein